MPFDGIDPADHRSSPQCIRGSASRFTEAGDRSEILIVFAPPEAQPDVPTQNGPRR